MFLANIEQLAHLPGAAGQCFFGAGVKNGAIAHDLKHAPDGQHIVANDGDAIGCQPLPADLQDRLPDGVRGPAVDAVTYNIVETVLLRAEVRDTAASQLDVGQSEPLDAGEPLTDLRRRDVETNEMGVGKDRRERNNMPAGSTADFKCPRGRWGLRRQAEQTRDRRQSGRLQPRVRIGRIWNRIVVLCRSRD